jgi:hypothetical protein
LLEYVGWLQGKQREEQRIIPIPTLTSKRSFSRRLHDQNMPPDQSLVTTISYAELQSSSPAVLAKISQGFGDGDTCKGIIAITDIPRFPALRTKALKLIHRLATESSSETLEELEDANSYYSVGWSHGKEKVEADKFDTGKGSFYFNPITDDPLKAILERDFGTSDQAQKALGTEKTEKEKKEFIKHAEGNGAFYASNIWPDRTLPELRNTAMELGELIRNIGKIVAGQCDEYVMSQCDSYSPGTIQNVIDNSLCCKARLLHYFPVVTENENCVKDIVDNGNPSIDIQDGTIREDVDFSDWCGWHNDHCSLTGLVPGMYFNADGKEVQCPDPTAGLYIKSRNGELVHVKVPSDALAFQIGGECVSV